MRRWCVVCRALEREVGLAAHTRGEVSSLDHEVLDDAVERAALEAKALLPGAQRAEVLRGQHA